MKKISILLLVSIFIFCGCTNKNSDNTTPNIQINRTSANSNNISENITNTEPNQNPEPTINQEQPSQTEIAPAQEEQALSEFSTQIKSKSSNRLNNIQITCNTLNNTIVEPGQEFSFCNTIGKSTAEKGYKKADVIVNKKIIQALGGGNCQVSTTLYNAVLSIPELAVTERHPHGKKVNYVPEGKDAAISHGSKDFKFINNTGKQIKIYAVAENNIVTIKIVSL